MSEFVASGDFASTKHQCTKMKHNKDTPGCVQENNIMRKSLFLTGESVSLYVFQADPKELSFFCAHIEMLLF